MSLVSESISTALWWARSAAMEILFPIAFFYFLGDILSAALEKISGVSGKLAPLFLKRRINRAILMVILLGIALSFTQTTFVANEAFFKLGEDTYHNKILFDFSVPSRRELPGT